MRVGEMPGWQTTEVPLVMMMMIAEEVLAMIEQGERVRAAVASVEKAIADQDDARLLNTVAVAVVEIGRAVQSQLIMKVPEPPIPDVNDNPTE